ncbi:unnamed protein product [Vitrella brassicaformis CCMP3155]|uniref:Uncharacterized protein n=1 Tax=Vitrella brassicaformis (strain CCMP3155) TaxID=1169540 RepID=A0A0G4G0M9_VITBC|nr:unnamed protein product [Vitrella brassicaformis CCMP3155]|eukprot:CEM21093.1 unnamed protein product [Vitrella brassicaformis CCMP3155]
MKVLAVLALLCCGGAHAFAPSTGLSGLSRGSLRRSSALQMTANEDEVLGRRDAMTSSLAAASLLSLFAPLAASAKTGDAPKASYFGFGGGASTLSEGAAYGSDQEAPLYSPYSVYGTGEDRVWVPNSKQEVGRKVKKVEESAGRIAKVKDYLDQQLWEEVRMELSRQTYDLRENMNSLASVSGNPDASKAAKKFYRDLDKLSVAARRKEQDAALGFYKDAVNDLKSFIKVVSSK